MVTKTIVFQNVRLSHMTIDKCQMCMDEFGQEPSDWGDSSEELIDWYKHKKFHLGEDIEVPWFWKDEVG